MSGENGLQACVFLRRDLFNTWCSLGESLNLPSHNHIAEFLFQSYAKKAEAERKCSQCCLLMPSQCSFCLEHDQLQQQRQHDQPQQHLTSEKSRAKSSEELVGRRTPRVMLTPIECLDKTLSSASSQNLSDKTSPSLFSASGISTEKQLRSSSSSRNLATETLPVSSSGVAHLTELSSSTTSSRQECENETPENKNEDSDGEPSSAFGFSQECCCESEKSPLASSHLANSCETQNSESTPEEEFADVTGPPLASESSEVSQLKSSCQDLFTSSVKESSEENTINPTPTSGDKVKEQFECMDCGKYFAHKELLTKHIMTHTGQKLFNSEDPKKCKLCSKVFPFISKLQRHMQVHRSEKLECEDCGKCFKHKESLQKHTRAVHEGFEKLSRCGECGKEFPENYIKRHKLTHGVRLYKCDLCDKDFTHSFNLRSHKKSVHQGLRPFACEKCKKSFATRIQMIRHALVHTDDKPHECTVCEKRFKTKLELKRHALVHTDDKPHECTACEKRFKTKTNLKHHVEYIHGEPKYECATCGKKFKMKKLLNEHVECMHNGKKLFRCTYDGCTSRFWCKGDLDRHCLAHERGRPYQCDLCDKAFFKSSHLIRHKESVHEGLRPFACDKCEKSFTSREEISRHAVVHTDDKPHECTACEKRFKTKTQLKRHVKRRHREGNCETLKMCDKCGRQFLYQYELDQHKRIHDKTRPFHCDQCVLTFYRESRLREHKLVKHSAGERVKPFSCEICGKGFHMKYLLRGHVKSVHSDKPAVKNHVCILCNAKFKNQSKLKQHRRTHGIQTHFQCPQCPAQVIKLKSHIAQVHRTDKQFVCQVCNKAFKLLCSLWRHKRIHNPDVKKYFCEHCDKSFLDVFRLKEHTYSHTGERPFQCPTCGATFAQSGSLSQHIKIHTGQKAHACRFCGKRFIGTNDRNRHERTHTREKKLKKDTIGSEDLENISENIGTHTHDLNSKEKQDVGLG